MIWRLRVGYCARITLIGCASAPCCRKRYARKSSISAAAAVGAQSVPKSALHLKMAKDQVTQAEAMIQDGKAEEGPAVFTARTSRRRGWRSL